MWSLSFLSSLRAVLCDLVKLGLRGCGALSTQFILALSSSASCWLSFVQAASMEVMYSKLGGCFGETAKLGPLARTDLCALVKGLLDRLMTHFGLGSSPGEEPCGLFCLLGRGKPCFWGLVLLVTWEAPACDVPSWEALLSDRDSTVCQGCVACLETACLRFAVLGSM